VKQACGTSTDPNLVSGKTFMKKTQYHIAALLVIMVWGTTFVATKMLLSAGLSPRDVLFYRFFLAYIGIWFFGPRRLFAGKLKDEFLLILAGITGGSLYYIAGNTALEITQASNVALLACTAPILTILFSRFLLKNEGAKKRYLWQGSLLALAGVVFVAFSGRFILRINPLGDMLGFAAAVSWAFYTILLKRLSEGYSMLFITRKVFFYGIVALLPLFLYKPLELSREVLAQPVIWGNLLYLGLMASLLCYFLWNTVVKRLGTIRANNYVYLSPVITMTASVMVLNETITVMALAGALLILVGVALAER
jgi:drug/metabolite transporter (DMT)-like permease